LDVLTDGPVEVVHCGFPRDDSRAAPALPMRLLRRHGTNAWFLAAYRLVTKMGERVELEVTPDGVERRVITLQLGDKVFQHTVPQP
jgi:hypothetical protein